MIDLITAVESASFSLKDTARSIDRVNNYVIA